ncbi:PKD domain-containing protein, partial [Chloroflexota bacterium]
MQPLTLEPDKTFVLSHTYSYDSIYTVTVTVADGQGGSGNDTVSVTVNNIEPTVNAGPNATVDEGSAFTRSGSFTDPGADTWTATVDYRDGSGVLPLTLNPDKSFTLSHIYSDNGTYSVTVNITDDDGGTGSDTATVNVNNMAPIVDAGVDVTINFGDSVTIEASFTDAGTQDAHTATIDWDDGTPPELGVVTENDGSGSVTSAHTYLWPGTYTVAITVTDNDNDANSDSLLVIVTAAPELLINIIIDDVMSLDIPEGTKNSLISKLEVAMKRLEDSNTQNDVAAINALEAFVNSVEAQRGKKILSEDADALITKAQEIIASLNGG